MLASTGKTCPMLQSNKVASTHSTHDSKGQRQMNIQELECVRSPCAAQGDAPKLSRHVGAGGAKLENACEASRATSSTAHSVMLKCSTFSALPRLVDSSHHARSAQPPVDAQPATFARTAKQSPHALHPHGEHSAASIVCALCGALSEAAHSAARHTTSTSSVRKR